MRSVAPDAVDQSVVIRILDSTDDSPEQAVEHDSAGIALWYRREGAAKVAITPAALAALTTAHTDGGIEHIDDGYYRLDVPDAAFVDGAPGVMIGGAIDGMFVVGVYIPIVAPLASAESVAEAVVDVTLDELIQGTPPATPTVSEALMALYMAFRNQTQTTGGLVKYTNDAGTVVFKGTLADDETTFTKSELVAGP